MTKHVTKNLIKKTTFFQDFIQDVEIGTIEDIESISVSAYDQFDFENYLTFVDFIKKNDTTITVKVPVDDVKRFERGQMIIVVIAIQGGEVTNPCNIQVEISRG